MFSKNIILQNFKLKKNRKHTKKLNQIFKKELINIIGGSCGTTPDHIKIIVELAERYEPRKVVQKI